MDRGAIQAWDNGTLHKVHDEIPEERESRFNDVIADPAGRVFCGTMPAGDRLGHLYRLDNDGSYHHILAGIGCSNGMGFTPDRKQMYYTDSMKHEIYLFDYDIKTGNITNQRLFVKTSDAEGEGAPDGMTVDAEGYVWSARWGGSCLVRYAPDGTEERRIVFPAKKVSSVVFGGEDYSDMYVTTAGGDQKAEDGEHAGSLFRLKPGIMGVPEFASQVAL